MVDAMTRFFKKVLVANRGEIAVRVIRCLRELGIPSVAVYSSADGDAPHVRSADESVWIGKAHPLESYLNQDALIRASLGAGADAVHPGYGFLAENAGFAERVEGEGMTFIGPPASAIRLMGDKIASRRTMAGLSIPVLPGSEGAVQAGPGLKEEARRIGYPLLVKASGGGGGKGMRLVREEESLTEAVEACRRESRKAFGDETVFLERFVEGGRHVEFQVLGDRNGNFVHLFERECSIQRRNQKLVEETPCVTLDEALRREMGHTAVAACEGAGASTATTVEFLVDPRGRYAFLEMNTRIQVEHPVTEETTGVDLVAEQIRIASGAPLSLRQEELRSRGHAIECRIYADRAGSSSGGNPRGPASAWTQAWRPAPPSPSSTTRSSRSSSRGGRTERPRFDEQPARSTTSSSSGSLPPFPSFGTFCHTRRSGRGAQPRVSCGIIFPVGNKNPGPVS
jgi:acetyl-CoA carboxylase biotin carboxylase subunit